MEKQIKIFETQFELAEELALEIYELCEDAVRNGKDFNLVLSGGTTPKILFTVLAEKYGDKIRWERVHLFWGDERCVGPEDEESNYGMTKGALLNLINIPAGNIHRIEGENNPEAEAERYSNEILKHFSILGGRPVFDLILLGIGEDGHTASIFPDRMDLLTSSRICETAVHARTLQKRITLTGEVINNAERIIFLVTGESKAKIVSAILNEKEDYMKYPAANINPISGVLSWYLNRSAAISL